MTGIARLTRQALKAKQDNGERTGSVPFGFELAADGVHLVALEGEQATIAEARRLRGEGLSLRSVAATLDERGMRSRNGRAFDHTQIARMCARVA